MAEGVVNPVRRSQSEENAKATDRSIQSISYNKISKCNVSSDGEGCVCCFHVGVIKRWRK